MNTKEHILQQAILLFAQQGYAGVSMRDLAKAAGIGVSGVYYHFPDKETLYLQTVQMAFSGQELVFSEVWQTECSAEEKLRLFVARLVQLMLADKDFHRLMQRELLDADSERMSLLAEGVFKQQFTQLMQVISTLVPEQDAHLIAVSVIGLVCHFLEMQPLRRFLPAYQEHHEQPEVIAEHVTSLVLYGLKS